MSSIINKNMFGKRVNVLNGELVVVDKKLKNNASYLLTVETVFLMRFGIEFKVLSYNQQMSFIKEYIETLKWASAPFADDVFDYDELNEFKDEFIQMEKKVNEWYSTTKYKDSEDEFNKFDEENIFGERFHGYINKLTSTKMISLEYNTEVYEYLYITKSKKLFPTEFSTNQDDYKIKRLNLKLNINEFYNTIDYKSCKGIIQSRIISDLYNNSKVYSNIKLENLKSICYRTNPYYYNLIRHQNRFNEIIGTKLINIDDSHESNCIIWRLDDLIKSLFHVMILNYFTSQVVECTQLELENEINHIIKLFGDKIFNDSSIIFIDSMYKFVRDFLVKNI